MKSEDKKVFSNFIYNFLYQILIMIVPLILTPYLSKTIGAEGIGIYSYTFSVCNYFVMFAMLGMRIYGNREIAKVRNDREKLSVTFWELYFLQIFTTIISIIAYTFYIVLGAKEYRLYAILQIFYLFSNLVDLSWTFMGLEEFKHIVIKNVIVKLASVFMIILFVHSFADLWKYVLIMSIGVLIGNLSLINKLFRYIDFYLPTMRKVFSHLKPVLSLFVAVAAVSIYRYMDKIMIKELSNVFELGYYECADKINAVPICLATALGTVMMPKMANLSLYASREQINLIIQQSMKFVMFLSFGMCFGLISVSDEFIPIYLGEGFLLSAKLLKVLAVSGLFVAWANVIRTQYLIPFDKDIIYIKSVLLGAAVNFIINACAIPYFGAIGAAGATVIAEIIVALYQTIKVRKELDVWCCLKAVIGFFASGTIMLWVLLNIPQLIGNLVVDLIFRILIGVFVYIVLSSVYMRIFERKAIFSLFDFEKKTVMSFDEMTFSNGSGYEYLDENIDRMLGNFWGQGSM